MHFAHTLLFSVCFAYFVYCPTGKLCIGTHVVAKPALSGLLGAWLALLLLYMYWLANYWFRFTNSIAIPIVHFSLCTGFASFHPRTARQLYYTLFSWRLLLLALSLSPWSWWLLWGWLVDYWCNYWCNLRFSWIFSRKREYVTLNCLTRLNIQIILATQIYYIHINICTYAEYVCRSLISCCVLARCLPAICGYCDCLCILLCTVCGSIGGKNRCR